MEVPKGRLDHTCAGVAVYLGPRSSTENPRGQERDHAPLGVRLELKTVFNGRVVCEKGNR